MEIQKAKRGFFKNILRFTFRPKTGIFEKYFPMNIQTKKIEFLRIFFDEDADQKMETFEKYFTMKKRRKEKEREFLMNIFRRELRLQNMFAEGSSDNL